MIHFIANACLLYPLMPTTTFSVVNKFIKTDVYDEQVIDTYYIELEAKPPLYVEVSEDEHSRINAGDLAKIDQCTNIKQLIKKPVKYVQSGD
jgi:hypothetical protein